MKANWAPADCEYAIWASPITSPRPVSWAALLDRLMSEAIVPTILLAIGAIAVSYLVMIVVSAGSAGTSRLTTTLLTAIWVGWSDARLILMSMSVTRRPNADALVTGIARAAAFGSMQLYALWVWP